MASRRLTFDASKPQRSLGGPATARVSAQAGFVAPARVSQRVSQPVRRNALQTITEQERQRANTQHEASKDEHAKQKARVAEWIYAYRHAFPKFVFYFDGVDEATQRRLSVPIQSLGAKVEAFFSAQTVTHVLVPQLGDSDASNVVSLAKRFQLKIWDLDKLENRVLVFLLPGYSASGTAQSASVLSAKRKLSEAFSAEKMLAMRHKTFEGSAVAHSVDFYYFKYYYVLAEDASHLSRPAIIEDFRQPEAGRDPPWPKLYMVPQGRCPFVQYEEPTTSSKDSESDADKENVSPEPETIEATLPPSKTPAKGPWTPTVASKAADEYAMMTPTRPSRSGATALAPANAMMASVLVDSNASGVAQSRNVTSTSTAFQLSAMDPALQQSLLQNLNNGRVTQLSKMEQPATRACRTPPVPRTKKPRVPMRRPMAKRPGYCENCRVKYEDMLEHVKTAQHKGFAANERNWLELDALLDKVKRPEQQPTKQRRRVQSLYLLSSDDAAHVTESAPPSLGAWGGNMFASTSNMAPSMHMLASGRLSTETTEQAPHTGIIDLRYSTTNSSSGSPSHAPTPAPAPRCRIDSAESLADSLETPDFRNRTNAYDQDATLLGEPTLGNPPRLGLETPTRPSRSMRNSAINLLSPLASRSRNSGPPPRIPLLESINGKTLVQPSRARTKFATQENGAEPKHAAARDQRETDAQEDIF
ncbi:Cdc7p-Dbf4p kinase complex regulatory subunit [Linderina pennispora]|nr:Cdc7p-Dbf4p kinase complex regulatory subunit [Linderina pennispora]